MKQIVLCADSFLLSQPEIVGLSGENLCKQTWLKVFSSGMQVRSFLQANSANCELWILSCEDVSPINLAAAVRKDNANIPIFMLALQNTGSLSSRAYSAGVTKVLSYQELAQKYFDAKGKHYVSFETSPQQEEAPLAQRTVASEDSFAPTTASSTEEAFPIDEGTYLRREQSPFEDIPPSSYTEEIQHVMFDDGSLQSKYKPQTVKNNCFLLPVMSGSGGSGKSTISTLLALLASIKGYKTLLIDCDLQFGETSLMLSNGSAPSVQDVLQNKGTLANLHSRYARPACIKAPELPELSEKLTNKIPELLERASKQFDFIVVNTQSYFSELHAILLERASKALFLIDQRSTSLKANKRVLDLCARCAIATTPFVFVANKCTRHPLLTAIDVSCALSGVNAIELRDGGPKVEEYMSCGLALQLIEERNPSP